MDTKNEMTKVNNEHFFNWQHMHIRILNKQQFVWGDMYVCMCACVCVDFLGLGLILIDLLAVSAWRPEN